MDKQAIKINYQAGKFDEAIYKKWEAAKLFEIDGNKAIQNGQNFCIMMPPPNVTGVLHIGHALTFSLQDVIVRYKRMEGYKTLYQPGLDHAGIATQNIVEKQLRENGLKKEDLGREEFIKKVWEWKEKSGGQILVQLRKLGISPAFSRTRFTMDDGMINAVKNAFINWYEKGLIVQDYYMINHCTHCGAISDIEVSYKDSNSKLYHLKYPISGTRNSITIATTRPETLFGDTAIMVNPSDPRYSALIGSSVDLPLANRTIPIIADEYVDMSFGTGVVKVTPAHDLNDYAVGKRHNLEFITIFDKKGVLNDAAGEFSGQDRLEAREAIVEKLQREGFVEKIENYNNKVGHCYRCDGVIEPYISKQWFVKKQIANNVIAKLKDQKIFYPPNWKNNFDAWMNELKDWCISRQLWWGHRIPVFYCQNCEEGHRGFTSKENAPICPHCKSTKVVQDEDVLDTWFSSALWAFSTLGYGNDGVGEGKLYYANDLKDFFPNSLLITGFDILFFWVARMLFASEASLDEIAFKDVYLHALVRDEEGAKMSKSKGNVIDPLDEIEKFSSDILRFSLCYLCALGRDIRLSSKQLEVSKNFTNKLINASNFLLLYKSQDPSGTNNFKNDIEGFSTPLGIYAQSRLNACITATKTALDGYRFNDACVILYKFFWDEFCDNFIELAKASKESIDELASVFKDALLLLHPFMPFISEYLYQSLNGEDLEELDSFDISKSIMIKPYPKTKTLDNDFSNDFSLIIEGATTIRRLKSCVNINGVVPQIYILCDKIKDQNLFSNFVKKLARVEKIDFINCKIEGALSDISENMQAYLDVQNIDLSSIKTKLENQNKKLENEIIKLENMLKNEKFLQNAPKELVETNSKALETAKTTLAKVQSELKLLNG